MRSEILHLLQCPLCHAKIELTPFEVSENEIRRGALSCLGPREHVFEIKDGIIRFQTGFDHEAVKKELHYENSTYDGDPRLRDEKLIAQYPDTLAELWPHVCHFGPDFRALIDYIAPQLPKDAWVLDVGTGPCWSSRLLADRGWNVMALDVNDANYYGLGTAEILFSAHDIYFERILESMTNLPFKNESIDAITFNAAFHHTPDMEKTLDECERVLKPGGVAAMVNEEFASVRQRFFNHETVTDTGSHHTILYSDFEREAASRGFEISYRVAEHVHSALEKKLSAPGADVATKVFETFPSLLKKLNSALIILTKPKLAYAKIKQRAVQPARAARVEPAIAAAMTAQK